MSESTDALSRLRAGLDRDEAIARAAAASDDIYGRRESEDCPDWLVLEFDCEGISVWNAQRHQSEGSFGHETELTRHLTVHDPSRVLRQSEKLREAADLLDSAVNGSGPAPDLLSVCAELSEILASIYPRTPERDHERRADAR